MQAMRITRFLLLVGLGCLNAGCALLNDATHLVAYKASESIENCWEQQRNRRWAQEAWTKQQQVQPVEASADYADGFVDGFSEFLYAGGNGDPPVLPPKKYRHLRYQTPEGYQAIEDWFAGYRHGVAVAKEKGFRELVTGPSSLRTAATTGQVPNGMVLNQAPNFQLIGEGVSPGASGETVSPKAATGPSPVKILPPPTILPLPQGPPPAQLGEPAPFRSDPGSSIPPTVNPSGERMPADGVSPDRSDAGPSVPAKE
jgi:hypothetical protein